MPAFSVGGMFKDFWQALVSNDRHASHDSPYRTGQHVPLPQSRHAPLTSIATSAIESRSDLNEQALASNASVNGHSSPNGRMSPSSPYSPGMRSALRRQSTDQGSVRGSIEKQPATEIQMQNFSEGLPPPPPVAHSWKRIERWVRDNYAELHENLCEGATGNDVNELEHQLDCTLPIEVRESLMVHDGQEHGGRPTGIFFGCMLLDCEEIYDEWCNWRAVNEQFLAQQTEMRHPSIPIKAFASASSSSSMVPTLERTNSGNPIWREELQDKQQSQPPNAVQRAYTHPAWIPLARDWGGNLIAVDLAPGPMGKWGQIILCGRDYDTKYVIARSWAIFLANVADDFSAGDKIVVDEENNELRFKPFRNADPPYMEIMRWRCDQKHGRRMSAQSQQTRRRTSNGLKINPNVGGGQFITDASPYASPVSATSERERGRSPQRFGGGKAPVGSSPLRPMVSSPLARVTEETGPSPLTITTNSEPLKQKPSDAIDSKLVSVDTPRQSGELPAANGSANGTVNGSNKENEPVKSPDAPEPKKTSKVDSGIGDMGDMKTVEI
jgi:cell wall assembly regulator SMI1